LNAVRKLGVKNDGLGLDYFIPIEDQLPTILISNQAYIALVTGAAHATKRLPEDRIIELCKNIQQPIILLGGKDEAEKGNRIAQAAGSHVTNLCGALNLNQSAYIVQQSSHVISHDTGLMHIAAAFQKPITSIWGNTVPEFGMYPYYNEQSQIRKQEIRLQVQNLACRPCSKIGHNQCPQGHFKCMRDVDLSRPLG
jgi:ADP-heptose:LPS heptosyltransferase